MELCKLLFHPFLYNTGLACIVKYQITLCVENIQHKLKE